MTLSSTPGSRAHGTLLLADISRYTGFLQDVADAHRALIVEADAPPAAYAIVSSLLSSMVASVEPKFRLVKFEGDALFAVADEDETAVRGAALLECLRACHGSFHERLATAKAEWPCNCTACIRIEELDLKFVVHHGDYVVQGIAGQIDLFGPSVNAVHRLLKNHARDLIGPRPYALVTDAAMEALDVPDDGMVAGSETYEDMPPIPVHVLALA
jgi:Protein of unknown function (DUF2652)